MDSVKAGLRRVGAFISAQLLVIAFGVACLMAYLFPHVGAHGGTIRSEYSILYGAVAFIFLVSGLQLPPEKLRVNLTNWRLHVVVQGVSFVVIPLVVVAIIQTTLATGNLTIHPGSLVGLLVAACIPTTIASNVVFTRAAGGDDAAAIVEVVLGNVFGSFLTPVLVYGLFPQQDDLVAWRPASPATVAAMYAGVAKQLGLSVLLPLAVGQCVRWLWTRRVVWALERFYLAKASTLCLALLIWTTFSGAFETGAFRVLPGASLAFSILVNVGLYLLFTVICFYLARPPVWLVDAAGGLFAKRPLSRLPRLARRFMIPRRMSKEQTVAVCFCGAAKSAGIGVPLVTAMWAGIDDVGRAVIQIPVVLYTIEQVFIAQVLVYVFKRYVEGGKGREVEVERDAGGRETEEEEEERGGRGNNGESGSGGDEKREEERKDKQGESGVVNGTR